MFLSTLSTHNLKATQAGEGDSGGVKVVVMIIFIVVMVFSISVSGCYSDDMSVGLQHHAILSAIITLEEDTSDSGEKPDGVSMFHRLWMHWNAQRQNF